MHNYIGEKFKEIRVQDFKLSQEEFVEEINKFVKTNYTKSEQKILLFNQNIVSVLENKSRLRNEKFITLLNYLFLKKQINPLWIILPVTNANTQRKYINNIAIDADVHQKLNDIKSLVSATNDSVYKEINDIDIILRNS